MDKKVKGKILKGVVVSDVNDKTIVVSVATFKKHSKYKKFIKAHKRYKVHDEHNTHKVGESVKILECSPKSKDKKFIVTK